jgi:triphosphoribosyl-dephospho-CoA synthetase
MDTDKSRQLRADLGDLIGRDIVYVTAANEDRHFDPISFVQQYATEITIVFCTSAVTALREKIRSTVADLGKKGVDATWSAVQGIFKRLTGLKMSPDEKDQNKVLAEATDALAELRDAVDAEYLETFFEAGQIAIEDRLLRDNFPKTKAKRLSKVIAKRIKEQVRG